jgi:hypothetical protein
VSCGGGGGGVENPISGEITGADFIIPAGQTRTAVGDLTVRTTNSIVIDGTLLIVPGSTVKLFTDGDSFIRGRIAPTNRSAEVRGRGTNSGDFYHCADNITLTPQGILGGGITAAGPGDSIVMSTNGDGTGTINISAELETQSGEHSTTRDVPGGSAGVIILGTSSATVRLRTNGHPQAGTPRTVIISGTLKTGRGGNGFSDLTGTLLPNRLDLKGTNGGSGGSIAVEATETVNLAAATIVPGDGGTGGSCGSVNAPARAPSGTAAGQKGLDVRAETGSGGSEGFLLAGLNANTYVPPAAEPETTQGASGGAYVAAGDGGPAGDGGATTIVMGTPGASTFNTGAYGEIALTDGGNGGASNTVFVNGGNGGGVTISFRPAFDVNGFKTQARFQNYGRGGAGFNGCLTTPLRPGSNGGRGGNLQFVLPSGESYPYTHQNAFIGGNAGPGSPPGLKGTGGSDITNVNGQKFADGQPGAVCTETLVVILDHALVSGGQTIAAQGTQIPLSEITGGQVQSHAEGCNGDHLHGVIVYRGYTFQDPAPQNCGHGRVILVTRDGRTRAVADVPCVRPPKRS